MPYAPPGFGYVESGSHPGLETEDVRGYYKSDQSDSDGVRRLTISLAELEGLTVSLPQSFSRITSKIGSLLQVHWWLWFYKTKTPYEAFKSLQLDKLEENPFENPKFPAWKYFVEATNPKKEDAIRVMFDTMLTGFGGEAGLLKVLNRVKSSHKFGDTVQSLRDYQIERWVDHGETTKDLFLRLNLNKLPDIKIYGTRKYTMQAMQLFESPEFTMWGAFINKKGSGYHTAFELLIGPEGEYSELMRAQAGIRTGDENFHFAQGLLYSRLQYMRLTRVGSGEFFKKLRLREDWLSRLAHKKLWLIWYDDQLLIRLWLDYVYMRSLDKAGIIADTKVKKAFINVLGKDTSTELINMLHSVGDLVESSGRLKKRYWSGMRSRLRNSRTHLHDESCDRELVEGILGEYG